MKNISKTFLALAVIGISVSGPSVSFAKNDNGNKGKGNDNSVQKIIKAQERAENRVQKQEQKREDREEKSCVRAFGHLIAPGWVKKNGPTTVGENCDLPFGIAKKFRGYNATSTPATSTPATSTPDTVAPVISNIVLRAEKHQITARFDTDERSDTRVF